MRVAVVTGVGPGIGRSVALGLARDGCDVALAARTQPYLEEVAGEVEALGDGSADALARSGDDRNTACQSSLCHGSPLGPDS